MLRAAGNVGNVGCFPVVNRVILFHTWFPLGRILPGNNGCPLRAKFEMFVFDNAGKRNVSFRIIYHGISW